MEYFAGLDVSMEETHVCVVDRDGKVILEAGHTAPKTIAARFGERASCRARSIRDGADGPDAFSWLRRWACRWSALRAAKLTRR